MTVPSVGPCPDDFQIEITDDGRVLRWQGELPSIAGRYMLGLRPAREPRAIELARDGLRKAVWALHEHARRGDLPAIAHASVRRHLRA